MGIKLEEAVFMERARANKKYPKFRVHWSVKLLGYAWAAAVVFVIGMVVGGVLSEHGVAQGLEDRPEAAQAARDGQKAELVLEVPCLDQRGEFPTGCESVTAVMALNYAGVDISVDTFVDAYLPKGSAPVYMADNEYLCADPNECFLGDPRSEDGWGCYAPVIQSTIGRVLQENESERTVEDLNGKTLKKLVDEYVAEGVPVILWGTMGMDEPSYGPTMTVEGTGQRFDWIRPEHCLLLVGEEGNTYLFNDPLEGRTVAYDKKAVQTAYEALGSQALAIK